MSQSTELWALKEGDFFKVIGCEHIFRNLKLLRVTDGCCYVAGDVRKSGSEKDESGETKGHFSRLSDSHTMSCKTKVIKL